MMNNNSFEWTSNMILNNSMSNNNVENTKTTQGVGSNVNTPNNSVNNMQEDSASNPLPDLPWLANINK